MVDWKRHFDHVYCICYLGSKDYMLKRERLLDEFRRVGLLDDPWFLTVEYTTPDPWEKVIAAQLPERVRGCVESNTGFCSLGLASARIFRQALALGYRRILVMEDDLAFLKDLDELGRVIDDTPDRSLVMFDKFLDWNLSHEDYVRFVEGNRINGSFYTGGAQPTQSGAMYAVNQDAMRFYIDRFGDPKEGPRATDTLFCMFPDRAVAVKNAAIQVLFSSAMAPTYCTGVVNSHNLAYRPAGLDLSEYNVPDGYGYDTPPVELPKAVRKNRRGSGSPGACPPASPAAGPKRLKVNVYAITKNEAKFVDRWMDSMSEADGVYVLDTGSTDDTVEKLKARGAHVEVKTYDPWRFDVPRNDSMALCPEDTDVYVCTDLDEVLNKGWRKALEDSWNGYVVEHGEPPTRARYDYVWGWEPDGKTPKTKFRYEKIHDANYKWKSPVHEILVRRDESKPERWLETRNIVLEHHPDPSKSRGSYLGLLELAVKEDPSDARITHYLAREYGYRGWWDAAIKWHKKYLEMPGWDVERAASMKMLGTAYWNKGDRDLAELWFRRGAEEAPGQRESEFEWAGFLVQAGDWARAADVLMRMLARTGRSAPPTNYVTDLSAWGAPFYDRLGMALWYSGRKDEARAVYKVACLKYPGNDHLRHNLRNCGESEADKMAAALLAAWPEYKQEKETK